LKVSILRYPIPLQDDSCKGKITHGESAAFGHYQTDWGKSMHADKLQITVNRQLADTSSTISDIDEIALIERPGQSSSLRQGSG
jgi:hypothetical protein